MYGLTRGALTLIGAAAAGVLLWLAANIASDDTFSMGDHWATAGLVAAAGLTMALSQLLGGWTKWGLPRLSGNVFLIAFVPVLIAGGWILAAAEPGEHWLGSHVRNWSGDLGIETLVGELTIMFPAVAFGIGLVFGFTFDTTGPRVRKQTPVATPAPADAQEPVAERPVPAESQEPVTAPEPETVSDDRRVHIREGGAPPEPTPEPESEPRTEEPTKG
jgi:hypothetical protein